MAGFVVYGAVTAVRRWYALEVTGCLDCNQAAALLLLRDPLFALSQTVPAFVAGFVARQRGALVGAIVGFGSWLCGDLLFGSIITYHSTAPGLLRNLTGAALGTAIVGLFAGFAGERLRAPPNNSFNATPLRGAAASGKEASFHRRRSVGAR